MAERYLFFNDALGDERVYQASDFAWYFDSVLKTGLIHIDGVPELEVKCDGSDLRTYVVPGRAIINGYGYENTSDLYLTHDTPDSTNDRIDRIVLRLDLRNQNRYIRSFVIKGEPSENPVPPNLQRDEEIHELSLAQIRVRANTSVLNPSDLIDERLDDHLCGLVEAQNMGFVGINDIKGIITMWSGTHSQIPNGWHLCDGQNGTPDLRDRFILGAMTESDIGGRGGEHEVTLTESQMPSHAHSGSTDSSGDHRHHTTDHVNIRFSGPSEDGYQSGYTMDERNASGSHTNYAGSHSHTLTINSSGGDQPHENRPAFYKLAFIMRG